MTDTTFQNLLLARMQKEHSEVICGNFVLDIKLALAEARVGELERALASMSARVESLNDRCQAAETANDELKRKIDPARGARFKKAR